MRHITGRAMPALTCLLAVVVVGLLHRLLPAPILWLLVWVLVAAAGTLLVPPDRRDRSATVRVAGGTGLAVLFVAALTFAVGVLAGRSALRGAPVDSLASADGRYEVRVRNWQSVIGEDGWDVYVERRDGEHTTRLFVGCLFSENSSFEGIRPVEAGEVRISTDVGPVSATFDPAAMVVTRRIPAELCQGYG